MCEHPVFPFYFSSIEEAGCFALLRLSEVKRAVRKALQDDFNTPAAINALRDLVFAVNVYLQVLVFVTDGVTV